MAVFVWEWEDEDLKYAIPGLFHASIYFPHYTVLIQMKKEGFLKILSQQSSHGVNGWFRLDYRSWYDDILHQFFSIALNERKFIIFPATSTEMLFGHSKCIYISSVRKHQLTNLGGQALMILLFYSHNLVR